MLSRDQIAKVATSIVQRGLVAIVAQPFVAEIRITIETETERMKPEAKAYFCRSAQCNCGGSVGSTATRSEL